MSQALEAADAILAKADATQDEIDAVKAPDKSALQELVDAITAENLQEGDWTEESWTALQTACAAVDAVLKDADASQEAIDAAKTALESVRKGLEARPVLIDTTLLEQAFEKADASDPDLYRWSGLMPMILQKKTAQAILARPVSQQQVNEAASALDAKLLAQRNIPSLQALDSIEKQSLKSVVQPSGCL